LRTQSALCYISARPQPVTPLPPLGQVETLVTNAYLTNWLYVWLFLVAGAALVVVILLFSKVINPSHLTAEKLAPYECGIPPVGNPWSPFAVRYFVFGLLFLVFDVEAVFLFPWALLFRRLGTTGFVEMVLFIAVLGFGLLYAWRKGALEWA
jgi:NADH:ubiquinone oxidoreductase subunit 3 (subunit A)